MLLYHSASGPQPPLWGRPIAECEGIPVGVPLSDASRESHIVLGDWSTVFVARMPSSYKLSDSDTVDGMSLWDHDLVGTRAVHNASSPSGGLGRRLGELVKTPEETPASLAEPDAVADALHDGLGGGRVVGEAPPEVADGYLSAREWVEWDRLSRPA